MIHFRSPFQPILLQERVLKSSGEHSEVTVILMEYLMPSCKRRLLFVLDKFSSIPYSSKTQVWFKRQQNQFLFFKYPVNFPISLQTQKCSKQALAGFFFLRPSSMTDGKKLSHQSKIQWRVCVRPFPRRCAKGRVGWSWAQYECPKTPPHPHWSTGLPPLLVLQLPQIA